MLRVPKLSFPFAEWPADDQRLWTAAFEAGDLFDDGGLGTHRRAATGDMLQKSYARFLRFIVVEHHDLLLRPPDERIDRTIAAGFAAWRRQSCSGTGVALELTCLYCAFKLICPGTDWSWLGVIARCIAASGLMEGPVLRVPKLSFPFAEWPADDQRLWTAAFEAGDLFDDGGSGAHLCAATRLMLQKSYARFLRFIVVEHHDLLLCPPNERIDRTVVAGFVAWRRQSCRDTSVVLELRCLCRALKLICPGTDWSWLGAIVQRIAASALCGAKRHHLITSAQLYALGVQLMDRAVANTNAAQSVRLRDAYIYRDGLMIALLAVIPLRRRTFAALTIGRQLVKAGALWALDIPAEDTKTRQPLEYSILPDLSERIDQYLERYRRHMLGADPHNAALWPSRFGRPIRAIAIYEAIGKRTRTAFGFGVSPHRFRHAAASFWAIQDPTNARGVKDLLGHASFQTTEKHYIRAQSQLAGRKLAHAVDKYRDHSPRRLR